MKVIIKRMTTENKTLRCSDCKCWKISEYFSINGRGVLYKTCDKCRHRHRCDLCDDEFFTSKSDLESHIKRMHRERIHCLHCRSFFYNNSDFQSHMQAEHAHPERIHCLHCRAFVYSKSDLRSHMKAVHCDVFCL